MELLLEKNLRRILTELDWSVPTLSKKSNVSVSTIKNWMQGKEGNMSQVKMVAEVLGLTLDELCFSDTDVKSINPFKDHESEINAGLFEVVLRRVKK